jgi:hypothetical protein
MLSNIAMKNLLSVAWKNSSRHKIGQFELVKLWPRPSSDGSSFIYYLDYVALKFKRRWISLGHGDRRKAEKQRTKKEKE